MAVIGGNFLTGDDFEAVLPKNCRRNFMICIEKGLITGP